MQTTTIKATRKKTICFCFVRLAQCVWWVYFCARGVEVGVLLCILGTVVRYKIMCMIRDLVKFFFFKKDVTINSILTNNRDSGDKEEEFR